MHVCKYSADNRRRFAQRMHQCPGIEVTTTDSPEDTVRGADIAATCTDSMTPVLNAAWLKPGMHVVALTPREFDPAVARRPERVCRMETPEV